MLSTTKLHIEHLLSERGLVAVPSLGVFVSRRVPATVEGGRLTAPDYMIGFEDYALAPTDEELIDSVVRGLGCARSQAGDVVAHDVEMIRREINVEGRSDMGRFGALVSESGGLVFDGLSDENWLQSYDIEPLQSVVAEETAERERDCRREAFMRSLRRAASSAAAIATFGLMAFVFSHLPGRNATDPQIASIGFEKPSLPVGSISGTVVSEPPLVLIFNTPEDAASPVDEPVAAGCGSVEDTERYCLVVASLATRTDAEKYMAACGEDYKILEKDGRYRVYTLSGPTFGALNRAAAESGEYQRHPNAWICRR